MKSPASACRALPYSLTVGALGAVASVLLGGLSIASLGSSIFLLAVAFLLGRRLARDAELAAHPPDVGKPRADALDAMCIDSFAVWSRQIDTSRHTADSAILQLTRLFEGTVARLEDMVRAARTTLDELRNENGAMGAVARGEEDLQQALQALVSAHKAREDVVTVHARELREMAADVQRIAMQIRMLSFNAAVEAARAGSAAGGFGVVASEMRQLAAVSGQTGADMVKKVEAINATLEAIVRDDGRTADAGAGPVALAEGAIRGVVQRFAELARVLSETVRVMEAKTGEVHGDVSDALVAMQFQDRVSQLLQHVVNGLAALREQVTRGEAVDAKAWEARLSAEFSTAEEFENLAGRKSAAVPRARHEMTFF